MKVILVDDEPLALDMLEIMLIKIPNIEIIAKYTNPIKMIEEIGSLEVDVLFLDMEMGIIHGLDVSKEINAKYSHVDIVFVTAYPQFALEAFNVDAVDYLVKPVRLERLQQTISKITKTRQRFREKVKNSEVSIQVMGSFRLLDKENNEVKWRTKKAKELLAFLWFHRENPLNRFQVIEELWPNVDEERAATNMHTTVYQLRKTLKKIGFDNAISFVNDHYILTLPISSDYEQLQQLCQLQEQTAETMEQTIQLYQEGYLIAEDYRWAFPQQVDVKQKFSSFLEAYCLNHEQNNRENLTYEKCLRKLMDLDMYNENYMLMLLTYYGETANTESLVKSFAQYQTVLKDDLGISTPQSITYVYNKYMNYEKHSTV